MEKTSTKQFMESTKKISAGAVAGSAVMLAATAGLEKSDYALPEDNMMIGCASSKVGYGEDLQTAESKNLATLHDNHNFLDVQNPRTLDAVDEAEEARVPAAQVARVGETVLTCANAFYNDDGEYDYIIVSGVDESKP